MREALERWEPRIQVQDVTIRFDRADAGVLFIDVSYSILGTNDPRNLVFPFYAIPELHEPDVALASESTHGGV